MPWGAFPSGTVKLADDNLPVPNVTVLTFNYGMPAETTTNESGYFYMPVKFLVGSLFYVVYSNKQCVIRQWHNVNAGTITESIFKLPFAARYYDGWTNIGQMNNGMTIRVNGIQASMWTHIVRGIGDYYKYAAQDNLKTVKERLTIFANYTNGESASSTPLISKVLAEGHFYSWSKYIDIFRFPLYVVADLIAPDLILSLKTSADLKREADKIAFYQTIFHELGHSSHFKAIGAMSYTPLYVEAIKGYGAKNGLFAGYIAQGESWAEFLGQRYINRKYSSLSSSESYMKQYSEEYSDEKYTGTKWIPYGVWYDLIDNHIDEAQENMPEVIDDKVNTYTLQEIYNAFGPDQSTPQIYRDQLLQKYNNRQRCEVLKLYHSYGYGDSYNAYKDPDIVYTHEWKPFPLLDKFIESFRHIDVCGTERIFINDGDIMYNVPIIDAALYNYRASDGSMIKVWTKTIDNQTSADGRSYRVDSIRFLNKTGNVTHSYKPNISNFLMDNYFKFR